MGVLALINLCISLIQNLLNSFPATAKYAGLATSAQAAIAELEKAKTEILTKAELEGLRTTPQW